MINDQICGLLRYLFHLVRDNPNRTGFVYTMPSSAWVSAKQASKRKKNFVRLVSDQISLLSGVAKMLRKMIESETAVIVARTQPTETKI
jgi:hypothetical protein